MSIEDDHAAIERLRQRARAQRDAQQPTQQQWPRMGPELPLRTHAHAMEGTAGVDFFPRDACAICGGIPWWNGRRIVEDHDASKHNITVETDEYAARNQRTLHSSRSAASLSDSIDKAAARARRTTGERDDD